ncbi:hypothetical protein Undi14_04175 [Undibacterium sp. 14-3-2]|uniref:hypothetical protein n=1 Tax=Undibacterium sp. 14-3-2 TaxID=2800129 RepID=UPI001908B655|nr:hypothetical protein [Undibacterium sp. 14-3-2]MBK1889218.1 hypothetical protein [Undibacterium sp. 14-3-2]
MSEKTWYKVEVSKEKESTYHYYGSSLLNYEQLISSLQRGEYIRLDDLLYMERGEYKEWAEWDKSLIPFVSINPVSVVTVMQYKGDPRVISSK